MLWDFNMLALQAMAMELIGSQLLIHEKSVLTHLIQYIYQLSLIIINGLSNLNHMASLKDKKLVPLQLISFDEDKKLILSDEAIRIFNKLESEELYVVTVAGKYRTGKSYILNRVLLNQSSGFQVGPTINACTKGLWMWPELVQIKVRGKVKECIIIDTEGLGSLEEGENTDMKIFLMAILLSSYLIYNSVGSIDEKALENLSLVVNLAELLHKENNQYDSQELINSFPSFMWLVRDFSLKLEDQRGESITSRQYLQNALNCHKTNVTQASQRKNMIRKKLKMFFQDRNCFTLVRPTENEKDLQNLSTLPERRLRPQFVKLINEFKSQIHNSLKPKKVRGKSITPQGFIQLCKYFVDTINSGKLPSINSHWDNLCVHEASRIIENYRNQHWNKLHQIFTIQQEIEEKLKKVENEHMRIVNEANRKIERSFLGKLQKQLSKERIEKILSKILEEVVKQINEERYNEVKSIVNSIFEQIIMEFQQNKLESFQEIFARFEEIKQKYKHDSRIYESFYENSKDVFQNFVKILKDQWEKQHLLLNQKNGYLESAIQMKTAEMRVKFDQLIEENRIKQQQSYRLELENAQLKEQVESLRIKLEQNSQQIEYLRSQSNSLSEMSVQKYEKTIEDLQIKYKAENAQLQIECRHLGIELAKYEQMWKQAIIKERKIQREMQIFKNKCSEYLKDNIVLNETVEKLNKKVIEFKQQSRNNMLSECKSTDEVTDLIHNLNNKIHELEVQINIKEEENRNLNKTLISHKITHETLLKTPQNLTYATLKKNYAIEAENNKKLSEKIGDYELILSLCSFKCLLCKHQIERQLIKEHVRLCSAAKSVGFDVSYQYNGNGQIQFVIDVRIEQNEWTIRKTGQNIKLFLRKMKIQNSIFTQDSLEENIEQRRAFLDDIFNTNREQIWNCHFLIQFFGIDIHYLISRNYWNEGNERNERSERNERNQRNQRNERNERNQKSILMKSGLNLNMNLVNNEENSCNFMKTTKFNKKTFNFGPNV